MANRWDPDKYYHTGPSRCGSYGNEEGLTSQGSELTNMYKQGLALNIYQWLVCNWSQKT